MTPPPQATINPVNCQGVSGKGLAKYYAERYPRLNALYKLACQDKRLQIGQVLALHTGATFGLQWLICLPTKDKWAKPSTLDYVDRGMASLASTLLAFKIRSVSIPALGCGAGGLSYADVLPLMEKHLEEACAAAQARGYDLDAYIPRP